MSDIEIGKHRARATTAVLGTTSTGKEQIAVEFVFDGGPNDGRHITWYGYFSDKTLDRTLDSLRHCGWSGDDLIDLSGIDANVVELVVETEADRDGNPRPKVRWVNRISGPALKNQMSTDEASAFSRRMRGAVIAHRKSSGNGAPPSRDDGDPGPSDDDLF